MKSPKHVLLIWLLEAKPYKNKKLQVSNPSVLNSRFRYDDKASSFDYYVKDLYCCFYKCRMVITLGQFIKKGELVVFAYT